MAKVREPEAIYVVDQGSGEEATEAGWPSNEIRFGKNPEHRVTFVIVMNLIRYAHLEKRG